MRRSGLRDFGLLVLALALASCNGGPAGPAYVGKSLAALKAADGCDDVLVQLKAKTRLDMEKALSQNLESALEMVRLDCQWYGGMEEDSGAAVSGAAGGGSTNTQGGERASEYSTTNTQVAGVDEADFLKNDGSYIYILAGDKLKIIDAWPAADAVVIGEATVEGTPTKLFVHQDKAVVYSQLGPINQTDGSGGYYGGYYGGECTYGYDCEFTGDGQILKLSIYDIVDKTAPVLLRETTFSGSYLNSRRIGDIVHTVVVFPEVTVPGLLYWPEEMGQYWDYCWNSELPRLTEFQVIALFEQLWSENLRQIDEASITQFLPGAKDVIHSADGPVVSEGLLADCSGFYISQSGDGKSLLSLVSLDATGLGPLGFTTIVGKPGAVYASADALYIADRHYLGDMNQWYYYPSEGIQQATTVHKFRLAADSVATVYAGSGVVKGGILNQFSMDEQDGVLRLATSLGHVPDPNVYSTVVTLAEENGELQQKGIVDHLAPEEDIRSVRFDGNLAFVVTFKKTDPLFVIDVSNPEAPVLKGELQIPGFSTYMHLMDDGHVLSIGYDADDQGSFAWFKGIQLQVFDVTDAASPTLLHRELIGTRGSTTDAATNHLAFNYFKPKDMLAIPMVICEGGGNGGQYGSQMSFNGLLVYNVTVASGFTRLGGIPHSAPQQYQDPYGTCGNWWTDSNSTVKRSIIMDDFVYSVALDKIEISAVTDLENPIATVALQ
ncbi:MAG: beta-propeller domain-containing protein [Deltaproteobacteria bacterium]|nr:beta-propeller domain-containing protein [Deltaproteobacteria bacterium]